MKLAALAAFIGLAGSASAVATASADLSSTTRVHTSSAAPLCTPKITKAECGPATATLTSGGKTYEFKGGWCSTHAKDKIALQLTLGTIVAGAAKGNYGLPLFQFTVQTGSFPLQTVSADYAGKAIADQVSVSVKGKIPSAGTFASKATALSTSASFTGAWNCHGAVYSTP
jgi:hypothetical protein